MHWLKQITVREWPGRLREAIRLLLAGSRARIARLGSLVERPGSPPAALTLHEWPQRLAEEKVFLLSAVREIETEFLGIGEKFEQLAQQLSEIQEDCRALSNLTLGHAKDAPVQFAFQLLKKAEDMMLASYDQYDQVFATFSELKRRLAELSHRRDELMRTLLPINFISLSIRIEASRQPPEVQEVFSLLADNVCRTVLEVRSTLDRQFAELAVSERIAGAVMEEVSASVQIHRREVNSTMKTNRAQLNALNEAIRGAGAGAANLSQLNRAVSSHLGELVMAQQSQDITRQKIEHVAEAMEEMRAHLIAAGAAQSASKSEGCQFVYQAAQIQLKQAQDVFDELDSAAKKLESGIQNLRVDAGTATGVVVKVGETMLRANVTHQCEASMGQIVVTIKQAVQKTTEILAALEPLQARFLNCTQQATALAGDVRIAALNAQIFAIHAPEGATLEVLAGNMRLTSDETMERVEQLGGGLQQAAEMIKNLRQHLADFEQLSLAEQAVLTEETVVSQAKLLNLDRTIPVLIDGITKKQAHFAQSAEAISADLKFPATVAAASARFMGFFQRLVAWGSAAGAASSGASSKIDLLRSKYTMESERQAHATAMERVPLQPTAATASVELFDELVPLPAAVADSPGKIPFPGERPEPPPELPPSPAVQPAESVSPAPPKSAAGGGLGDNVELF
jgi:hypothetical protein